MKAQSAPTKPIEIISSDAAIGDEATHLAAVRDMFAAIAGRYDFLNHFLSLNIDRYWRRKVYAQLTSVLADDNATLVDLACGTGDLALKLKSGASAKVVGADFCEPMLVIAKKKAAERSLNLPFVGADAMRLPFADSTVQALTISFGLRNLPDIKKGLAEIFRVLDTGGRLVILEFTTPVIPGFRPVFNFYFRRILPFLGGVLSGSRPAYSYLPVSVAHFPDQRSLAKLMRGIGFADVKYQNLTGGVAAIHQGVKP